MEIIFTNNSFHDFYFSLIVLILPNEMDYFFNLEESIFASNIAKYIALTVSLVILFVFFL